MLPYIGDERRSALDAFTLQGLRRQRRRETIDVQTARCPRCSQRLVIYQAAAGPAYSCGCGRCLAVGRLPILRVATAGRNGRKG
jgi:hypothetical protein